MVAGRAHHNGVGVTQRLHQLQRPRGPFEFVRRVHRKIEFLGGEQPGPPALSLHRGQTVAQRALGRRVGAQGSAEADDERLRCGCHVITHLIAIGLTGAPTAPTTFSGDATSWNSYT